MHPYDRWIQRHHEVDTCPPAQRDVRNARRAYLAMTSYIDHNLGLIMQELRRLGIDRDTIVVFTSDHGDMQGEHGMWFKRTYREWAMRVPLIVWQPGALASGRRVERPVSLIDPFPTFVELGGGEPSWPGADRLDGASLGVWLTPDSDRMPPSDGARPVFAEYCGEGTIEPMRMVRSGKHKYVHVNNHKPLLFDLETDPDETTNLCGTPGTQVLENEPTRLCLEGWDPAAIKDAVIRSQQERLMLNDALSRGRRCAWDYQPFEDAATQYVRHGFSTQETKRQRTLWSAT